MTVSATALFAGPALAAGPTNTSPPKVTGDMVRRGNVVADPGSWSCGSSCSFSYEWDRCDSSLAHCYPVGDILGSIGEGAPTSWSAVGATVTADSAHGWSGYGSYKVVTNGTASEHEGLLYRYPQSLSHPEAEYAFSAWVYSDDPQVFRVGFVESPSGVTNAVNVQHPGGGWALLGMRAPIAATTTAARPLLDVQSASPTIFWADDLAFAIVIGSVPSMGGYTNGPQDTGSRIRVTVTATDASGSAKATAATPQIAPGPPPVNVTRPVLTGSPVAGSYVGVQPGTWTDRDQPLYHNGWQFQRCDDRLVQCVPTNTNLIADGDAESATGPWKGYGGAVVSRDGAHGKAGRWSLKVVSDGAAPMEGLNVTDSGQAADGYNDDVTVSMWVYSASWRTFRIGFDMNTTTTGNSFIGNQWSIVGHPGGGWALLSFSGRIPVGPGGSSLYLNPFIDAYPGTGGYTIWVDNVEVVRSAAGRLDSGDGQYAEMILNSTDAGSRIRIAEYADNGEFSGVVYSDATPEVAAAPSDPPASTAAPTIGGTAAAGTTLTATTGTWSGAPTLFTYLFQRCDTNIARCADTGANLLPNPTLESSTDPWKGYSATIVRDNAHGKSGAWALKVGALGAASMEGVNLTDAAQPSVSGGAPYTFSAWIYSAQPRTFRIGFDENGTNTGNSFLGNQSRSADHPGGGWALLSFKGTTKAATRYLNPFVDAYPGAGAYTIWVDDLELVNGTPGAASTFLPSAADEGSRIRVVVTASNAAGSASAVSDTTAWVTG